MSRIGIITINYGRPHILKLFLLSIERLRKEFGQFPVVCVSEKDDEKICQKLGVHHIAQQNNPASKKWNTAAKWMLTQDVDYIMIVGSDDIISNELMRNFISAMHQNCDIIGINKVYFYCSFGKYRGTFLPLQTSKMLGVCKTIHRRVIEKVGGDICTNNKNWSMDASITNTISPHVHTSQFVTGMVTDVKSPKNLNKITYWISKIKQKENPKIFYDSLSPAERSQLQLISNSVF